MVKPYDAEELGRIAADYRRHGAVHLPGFLGSGFAATVQAIVEAAETAHDPAGVASFQRSSGRLTIRNLWRDDPRLRRMLFEPAIAGTIARIIGSRSLRFWFDLTFIHSGGDGQTAGVGTPWHHDVPTYAFRGELMPSLWIALTPSTADRSRLMFIDGSHRTNQGDYRSPEVPKPPAGQCDGFVDLPDFDALIAQGAVNVLTWDCAPGDAILLHPATVHGARGHDGRGPQPRRIAMTTRWLGDDVRFLPQSFQRAQSQPAIAATRLKIGQRPHGDWFPLVFDSQEDRARNRTHAPGVHCVPSPVSASPAAVGA